MTQLDCRVSFDDETNGLYVLWKIKTIRYTNRSQLHFVTVIIIRSYQNRRFALTIEVFFSPRLLLSLYNGTEFATLYDAWFDNDRGILGVLEILRKFIFFFKKSLGDSSSLTLLLHESLETQSQTASIFFFKFSPRIPYDNRDTLEKDDCIHFYCSSILQRAGNMNWSSVFYFIMFVHSIPTKDYSWNNRFLLSSKTALWRASNFGNCSSR